MSFTSPIEELVNYIISHIHEGLLLNKLDRQQLKANISEGVYILQDIEFNSKSINQSLPYSSVHLHSARTSRMNLSLPPLMKLLENPVKIRLTDLEVDLISAKHSGDSVFLNEAVQLTKSDETPGLNVMTKSIGKFLSSINIEVILLTVNLISENHSISVKIPKLTFSDKNQSKSFKIEGFSVFLDKTEKIIQVDQVIEGQFKLNSSQFEVFLDIPKILVCISYDQLAALTQILNGLEVTDKIDSNFPELMETFNEISKRVDLGSGLRQQKGTVLLKQVDFFLTREKIDKTFVEYFKGIHQEIGFSHFHMRFSQFQMSIEEPLASLKGLKVRFFNFVEAHQENLFKSAAEQFSSEFFNNEAVLSEGTLVKKTVLELNSEGTQISFTEETCQIKLSSMQVSVNETIFKDLQTIYQNLLPQHESEPSDKPQQKLSVSANEISLEYIQELTENWQKSKNISINVILKEFQMMVSEKFEIFINKTYGNLKKLSELFPLFESEKLIFESITRPFQLIDLDRPKKYSAYFEQGQGYITVANVKTQEKKEKLKIPNESPPSELFDFEKISRISCSKLELFLVNPVFLILSKIEFPVIRESSSTTSSRFIFSIHEISANVLAFKANLFNFEGKGVSGSTFVTFQDFSLKSASNYLIRSAESLISLKLSQKSVKLEVPQLIIDSRITKELTSVQIESGGSAKSSKVLKVVIHKTVVLFSGPKSHSALVFDSSKLCFFTADPSWKVFVGAFKLLYTNEPLKASYDNAITVEESQKFCVLMLGSSLDVEVSKKIDCQVKNCEFITDVFYRSCQGFKHETKAAVFSLGTLIFHVAKDSLQAFEDVISQLPTLAAAPAEDLNESKYFDADSSPDNQKCIHSHNLLVLNREVNQSEKNFVAIEVSNVYLHLYPDYEFPDSGQSKKSSFYRITAKFGSLTSVYSVSNENLHQVALSLQDLQVINSIQGCEISKSLTKYQEKPDFSKTLQFSLIFEEINEKFDNFSVNLKLCPLNLMIDSIFLEFCLALCKSDSPELISESSPTKISKFLIEPLTLNLSYLQPVNFLNVENFSITFPLFQGENFESFDEALQGAWNSWTEHLEKHKILTIIGRLAPVVSVSNIAGALVHLVRTPFDSNSETTKHGLVNLLKVFSLEGGKLIDGLLGAAAKVSMLRTSNKSYYGSLKRLMKYL